MSRCAACDDAHVPVLHGLINQQGTSQAARLRHPDVPHVAQHGVEITSLLGEHVQERDACLSGAHYCSCTANSESSIGCPALPSRAG